MKRIILGLCALTFLAACSSTTIKDTALIKEAAIKQAQNSDQDPQQANNDALNIQVNAQKQDLYFYSPGYIEQAEEEIQSAANALEQDKPSSVATAHYLTAHALLERGLAVKEVVIDELEPSLSGLDHLKKINTPTLLKDNFTDVEDDIKNLIELIENNKISEALDEQEDVLNDITQLEIDTLSIIHLLPAQKALTKARNADAKTYATNTFKLAEKATTELEQLIKNKHKQLDIISDNAQATLRLAQHAENIAKAAKPLMTMTQTQAERHVIYIESLLDRITKALDHDAINHMPLKNQSIALAQAVERLSKQAKTSMNNLQCASEQSTLDRITAPTELNEFINPQSPSRIAEQVLGNKDELAQNKTTTPLL